MKIIFFLFLIVTPLLSYNKVIVKLNGDIPKDFFDGIKIGIESSNYKLVNIDDDKNDDDEDILNLAKRNDVSIVVNIELNGREFKVRVINLVDINQLVYYVKRDKLIEYQIFTYDADFNRTEKLVIFGKKLIKSILNRKIKNITKKIIIKKLVIEKDKEVFSSLFKINTSLFTGFLKKSYFDAYNIKGSSAFMGANIELEYLTNKTVSFFTNLSFEKTLNDYYRSKSDEYISLNMFNFKVGTSIFFNYFNFRFNFGRKITFTEKESFSSFNYGVEVGQDIELFNNIFNVYLGISYGLHDHTVIVYNDHSKEVKDTGYDLPIYFGIRYTLF